MYCNNCGAEIQKGMSFCEQCGNKVEKEAISKQKVKSKKRPIIIAVIAAILLLAVGIGVLSQTGVFNPVEHNLKLGYKYLEEGKYEEALLAFNKVLEIEENNTKAVLGVADAYVGLDRFEEAVEFLNIHIAMDNTKTELYDKLIQIYVDKGDYDGAKRVIENAAQYGYNFDINSLGNEVKEQFTKKSVELTGFQSGRYVVETNSKIVIVDDDGVKVKKVDSDDEQLVLSGKYNEKFVSDGSIVYLYDKNALKIKKLDIETGKVTDLSSVYNNVELEEGMEEFYGDGNIIGYCDGYLYFEEWYAPGSGGDPFVLDLKTNTYQKLNLSVLGIGTFQQYKGKIYYDESRMDAYPTSVYEANADGSGEKLLFKNVMNFNIVGNVLYYTQLDSETYTMYSNTTLKAYNLDTKQTTTIKNVTCSGWVHFTAFGYGYGQTSDEDVYGIHIEMPNGAGITKKGFIVDSSDNYIICREPGVEGSITPLDRYNIIYNGKKADITISSQSQIIGYFGGKVYYYDYAQYGGLDSITPTFE